MGSRDSGMGSVSGYIAPATKILRWPLVLAAMQAGERVWPLHVEMDLAGVCNARCGHCRFGDRQDGAVMGLDHAKALIDELVAGGTVAVTFSGGGEPTCNRHFGEIVAYAKHEGLRVGVYSNGIAGERLVQAGGVADWIYVSLDADNATDYLGVKGIDAFDQVCATVRTLTATGLAFPNGPMELSERRRGLLENILTARHYGCVVGVGFLLTGYNWHRAEAMRTLGLGLGADYVQFRPVAGLPSYEWVPLAMTELERIGALHSPERFRALYDHWRGVYQRGYEICRGSELAPCIGADGALWVCPNTRGYVDRELGNVIEEGFGAVWARREVQRVGNDCEPTCRNDSLNRTLEMVCESQPHEEFV